MTDKQWCFDNPEEAAELINKFTEERDALSAQVEQWRDQTMFAAAILQFHHIKNPSSIAAQCLAEVRAQAVEGAVEATASNKYSLPLRDACDLYDYANQLRQQAKENS